MKLTFKYVKLIKLTVLPLRFDRKNYEIDCFTT